MAYNKPSGTINPSDDPLDNAPSANNLPPTGGTPVSPTPTGVSLLNSGTSITIIDPRYETLLQTFMTWFERIDKDLELIGCHFETSRNALNTTKSQFQMLTRQVTEDIDVFGGEVTRVKESICMIGQNVDNGVNAWQAYENFMPEYKDFIAQTNCHLAAHPTTEKVHNMITNAIPPHPNTQFSSMDVCVHDVRNRSCSSGDNVCIPNASRQLRDIVGKPHLSNEVCYHDTYQHPYPPANKDAPTHAFGLDTQTPPHNNWPSAQDNRTGAPRALARMIRNAPTDVLCWHGGGQGHDGLDGVAYLMDDDLCSLGIHEDYYDVILESHEQVTMAWNQRSNQYGQTDERGDRYGRAEDHGPNNRAALKHPAWDRLTDTSSEGWLEFYKSLPHNAMNFMIVLTPFEAFNMLFWEKGHGLCLCGLGVKRYRSMGRALFGVLQQLLPHSDTYIHLQVELVANNSCNGFKLLWILQKHFIAMFDLTKEPTWPDWHTNVFRYAKWFIMHCDLCHHHSMTYTSAHWSLLFIWGLQGCYKDISLSYILMVLTHQQVHGNSAPLPTHLTILPLAQALLDLNHGGMIGKMATGVRANRLSSAVGDRSISNTTALDCKDNTVHIQSFLAKKAAFPLSSGPRGPPHVAPNMELLDCRQQAIPH